VLSVQGFAQSRHLVGIMSCRLHRTVAVIAVVMAVGTAHHVVMDARGSVHGQGAPLCFEATGLRSVQARAGYRPAQRSGAACKMRVAAKKHCNVAPALGVASIAALKES